MPTRRKAQNKKGKKKHNPRPAKEISLEKLLYDLQDKDRKICNQAIRILKELPAFGLGNYLHQHLDESLSNMGNYLIRSLLEHPESNTPLYLIKILKDELLHIHTQVLLSIEHWQNRQQLPHWIDGVQDACKAVRGGCTYLLGLSRDPRAIEPLMQIIKSNRSFTLRIEALRSLKKLGFAQTVPMLLERFEQEEDELFKPHIALTLVAFRAKEIVPKVLEVLEKGSPIGSSCQALYLQVLGTYKAPELIPYLLKFKQENEYLPLRLVQSISTMKDIRLTPIMLELLESFDPDIQCLAIQWFGSMQTQAAWQSISKLAQDTYNPEVKIEAAKALFQIAPKKAHPHLKHLLQNEQPELQQLAAFLLSKWDASQYIPTLLGYLHHPHWQVRKKTAECLKYHAPETSYTALQALLTDKKAEVRRSVSETLLSFQLMEDSRQDFELALFE